MRKILVKNANESFMRSATESYFDVRVACHRTFCDDDLEKLYYLSE